MIPTSPENYVDLTNSHQEQSTLESGKEDSEMDEESRSGLMALNTWVNGAITELMARASSLM